MRPVERIVTHPGEMLREEFMLPLRLSANAPALGINVPVSRIWMLFMNGAASPPTLRHVWQNTSA